MLKPYCYSLRLSENVLILESTEGKLFQIELFNLLLVI